MPEGHDTIIEVSNIMSFVLYTQILKQSVLKPACPGITLIKNLPGCLFIRTFVTEEFLHPLTYVKMFETVCMKLYVRSRHA